MLKKLKGNSLVVGSAVYAVSNILNALIPFALLPLLTRYLSPEEYGEVAMFQTILGGVAAFVGLSMAGAAGRKFFDGNLGKDDLAEFIGACLQILMFTSLVCLAVFGLFSDQFMEWLGLEKSFIFLAVFVSAANMIVQLRLVQWQVRKQAVEYGALQIARSLLNVLLSIVFVVVLVKGSDGRISAQICTAAVFTVISLWLLKREDLLRFFRWRPSFIREVLGFGVPLIPHVGGFFLLTSIDRLVINAELGLAQAGIYMVAVQIAAALAMIFDAVNKAYVPWLFERLKRGQESESRKIVLLTYGWFALLLCGAWLAFIIGPSLVTFVVGEQYAIAADVIGWLVLGQVFSGMYLMVTNYIFYSKRTGLLSLVTIVSGLINVILLLFLIESFGQEGAAYSFCIANGARFLFSWYVAQKRHKMPWFQFKTLFAWK